MRTISSHRFLCLVVACSGALLPAVHTHAASNSTTTAADEATAACEQSARRALAERHAPPPEVTFRMAPAAQPGLSSERQLVLSGEGQWRAPGGMRHVRFTCNVDRRTFETVGLVIRDAPPVVVARPVRARPPADPDLSHLSVASCESSAVQALKQRWPRASKIHFDGGTRNFRQASAERAELRGRGRAQPLPNAPETFFGFECTIDPQDGRVLRTRVTG